MVMAEYFIHDRLKELWQQINDLHLRYLDTEESPQKIEHRNKLEACIREYLCLSPHNRKFFCSETAEVLHRSASNKKDFSGYKAAVGWNAVSMYAGNLLSQPWRKEYRQIKTYSGFYKHQIEANLAGAETIFEAMGYRYRGNGVLILEGPVCPDRLTHVSQDSIVAFVECQILKTIWEEASNLFKISWLDVLEFRESHICSAEQSIRMLNFRYQEKRYQEQQPNRSYSQGTDTYSTVPRYPMSINNHPIQSHALPHPPITAMHSFPPQAGHAHVGVVPDMSHAHIPNYHLPITSHVQSCPPQCIYGNPYYNYPNYPVAPHFPRYGGIPYSVGPTKGCNGYCYPNGCIPTQTYVLPVPTGQLIELEGQNGSYDTPDGVIKNMRQQDYLESHKQLAKSTNLDSLTLSKSKEDGAGTFESWDYVYRNLESQGYNKDLGERGDLLQERRKNMRERKTKPSIELEDAFNTLNLTSSNSTAENNLKVTEGIKRFNQTEPPVTKPQEKKVPLSNSYDNITQESYKTIPSKSISNGISKTKAGKVISPDKPNHTLDTKKLRNKDVDKIRPREIKETKKKNDGSWNCHSCTYLNASNVGICVMCGKSKKVVDISMQVGGQECPTCTLVNPRDIKECQACNASLKGSPTYI